MRFSLLIFFITELLFAQGEMLWHKTNSQLPGNGYSWSTPLIMDHKLIWTGQDKGVAALNEETGETLWIDTLNFYNGSYDSPVGYDGKIFVGRNDYSDPSQNALFSLDAETGSVLWKKLGLIVTDRSSKPIDKSSKTIFISGNDSLYCFNINTGSTVWKKAGKYSNLLIDDGGTRLFASRSDTPVLEVLNLNNGELIWDLTLPDEGNYIRGMAYTNFIVNDYLILTPDWNYNIDSQYVYCINAADKNIQWKSKLIGHLGNGVSPVIMGDMVFAGTVKSSSDTSQNIVAFKLIDGTKIWENPARDAYATNTPYVIALDGKVFYENSKGDNFGFVCADAFTGSILWTSTPKLENPWPLTWGSPLIYNNKLFAAKDGDGIYCYNTGEVDGAWLMVSGNIHAGNSYLPSLVTKIGKNDNLILESYSLEQNYPNPFNPNTKISFSIPVEGFVKLTVYNSLGQKVASLINRNLSAGNYKTDFNASKISSGIYFYTLDVNGYSLSKKMTLMK